MNRLIRNEDLPETLWRQGDRVLILPPDLIRVWLALLDRHKLRALAVQQDGTGGCIGGISREATNKHLAWHFTGSLARVQLAMLDPASHMPHVADAFAQIFSGGRVAIADLPCGSACWRKRTARLCAQAENTEAALFYGTPHIFGNTANVIGIQRFAQSLA